MSKEVIAEEITSTSLQQEDDPMDIEEVDLTPLLESLSLLSHSSSQLVADDRANILKQIVQLPLAQLKKNLQAFDFPSWTDDTTTDLINELSDTVNIPSANITYLWYNAVYPKIVSLQPSAPRLMMNSILQLSKKEGKCVSDGLLLPLLFLSDLLRPQQELITKVISESLNPTQRFYLFKCIMDDGESYFSNANPIDDNINSRKYLRPWQDTTFQIINIILSAQPFMSFKKPCLFDLLYSIQTVVHSKPKDKGSMQTLLLLTSKYVQTLVEYQAIELVEEICQTSTMFLKRAILGHIASIKKNLQQAVAM